MNGYRSLRVALLGCGSVGTQVARLLLEDRDELAKRVGASLDLVGIAVRDLETPRDPGIPRELFTSDIDKLIRDSDIVIELMGGIEPARTHVLSAITSGADVVTANKALIATHGKELFDAAERVGAQLCYEAAVCAAIPIVRPLRESLAGDRVKRIMGIVNGTTNFILDSMDKEGMSFETALAKATELGYAEADPTADIEGFDAAQKVAILASLAFHCHVPVERVYREGITQVTQAQVESAKKSGHVIKLLAICDLLFDSKNSQPAVSARVYPALVSREHPLASVHGAHNAVFVEAESAGDLMFYGAGAGGVETASAVLGDLVSVARRHIAGGPGVAESSHAELEVLDISHVITRYSVCLDVVDEPGVLATISRIFANHGVSLEHVEQRIAPRHDHPQSLEPSHHATLVVGTHLAQDFALAATVAELSTNGSVIKVSSVLRIEGNK